MLAIFCPGSAHCSEVGRGHLPVCIIGHVNRSAPAPGAAADTDAFSLHPQAGWKMSLPHSAITKHFAALSAHLLHIHSSGNKLED